MLFGVRGGGLCMFFCGGGVQEPCLLAEGRAKEEIDFFLIFIAKFILITVFKFSCKVLWSYFKYALC